MRKAGLILLTLFLAGCPNTVTPPTPTPVPTPVWAPSISVCPDKMHFCVEGEGQVWLRGYSDYGAFSLPYDYGTWLDILLAHRVRLLREWATPFDSSWGGSQPYTFTNGKASLNEEFWKNADRFIDEAGRRKMFVLVDLVDHYNLQSKYFANNPLNVTHGGPLKQGLPDAYASQEVLDMVKLGVTRLKKHRNVLLQCVNEPGGYASIDQVKTFHKNVVQIIRSIHGPDDPRLIAVNPVPDAKGRPTIPSPLEVGADFLTTHGAGVENPKDSSTCTADAVSKRLVFIQKLLGVPVVSDDDGLWASNVPCVRTNDKVLQALSTGALSVAGFNHKGQEARDVQPDSVSLRQLLILRETTP